MPASFFYFYRLFISYTRWFDILCATCSQLCLPLSHTVQDSPFLCLSLLTLFCCCFLFRKLAEKENETAGGQGDSTQDVTMQSQKARLFFVPSYGLSVVSLYLSSCLCFWLTTVELSEFFLLGAMTSMWLWHWIRGCQVTSPLLACHTDEYQKSDALDMFVCCCCWLLLYSAILRSWIDTVLAYDSTWVASFLKCVFWISNEVMYLSADMAGATWNCCCLGTFCVHHTTMHSCYSLDLFTFTCLWRSTPSWVLSPHQ